MKTHNHLCFIKRVNFCHHVFSKNIHQTQNVFSMSSANCVSCSTILPILALYQCQTCSIEQKEASSAETLCEDCLVPHLRKEHSIVDSKGNKPLACTTHKFLFSNICKTCDVLFCSKCSAMHKQHDYQTIDKKATEIRTQVLNLLTINRVGKQRKTSSIKKRVCIKLRWKE